MRRGYCRLQFKVKVTSLTASGRIVVNKFSKKYLSWPKILSSLKSQRGRDMSACQHSHHLPCRVATRPPVPIISLSSMAGYWRVYFHQIGLWVHAKAWPKASLPISSRRIILPWQRQEVSTASTLNRNSVDEYYRQNQSIRSNKKMTPPQTSSAVNTLPCPERRFNHNIPLDFMNFKTSCTPTLHLPRRLLKNTRILESHALP